MYTMKTVERPSERNMTELTKSETKEECLRFKIVFILSFSMDQMFKMMKNGHWIYSNNAFNVSLRFELTYNVNLICCSFFNSFLLRSAISVCSMVAWRCCDSRFTISRSFATSPHHIVQQREPTSEGREAKRYGRIFVWSNDNDICIGNAVACHRSSM